MEHSCSPSVLSNNFQQYPFSFSFLQQPRIFHQSGLQPQSVHIFWHCTCPDLHSFCLFSTFNGTLVCEPSHKGAHDVYLHAQSSYCVCDFGGTTHFKGSNPVPLWEPRRKNRIFELSNKKAMSFEFVKFKEDIFLMDIWCFRQWRSERSAGGRWHYPL